ncbi:unnamed protein product [Arabis nemorensis]|uniref:Uncharacterized protein n=1 Tax=Arabis nemorensis TaxID=586526 RepID=A0A565BAI6_9BRAS|nr:unnamed protein product [Arabis nemorensis]
MFSLPTEYKNFWFSHPIYSFLFSLFYNFFLLSDVENDSENLTSAPAAANTTDTTGVPTDPPPAPTSTGTPAAVTPTGTSGVPTAPPPAPTSSTPPAETPTGTSGVPTAPPPAPTSTGTPPAATPTGTSGVPTAPPPAPTPTGTPKVPTGPATQSTTRFLQERVLTHLLRLIRSLTHTLRGLNKGGYFVIL